MPRPRATQRRKPAMWVPERTWSEFSELTKSYAAGSSATRRRSHRLLPHDGFDTPLPHELGFNEVPLVEVPTVELRKLESRFEGRRPSGVSRTSGGRACLRWGTEFEQFHGRPRIANRTPDLEEAKRHIVAILVDEYRGGVAAVHSHKNRAGDQPAAARCA